MAWRAVSEGIYERIQTTERGYFLCALVPCSPTDPDYSAWSTPVRDRSLANSIKNFQAQLAAMDPNSSTIADFNKYTQTPIYTGANYTYYDLLTGAQHPNFSADPTTDFFSALGTGESRY